MVLICGRSKRDDDTVNRDHNDDNDVCDIGRPKSLYVMSSTVLVLVTYIVQHLGEQFINLVLR